MKWMNEIQICRRMQFIDDCVDYVKQGTFVAFLNETSEINHANEKKSFQKK